MSHGLMQMGCLKESHTVLDLRVHMIAFAYRNKFLTCV